MQRCKLCLKEIPETPRYPRSVCNSCASKVASADGRRLTFYNSDLSGGFLARYTDTQTLYPAHECYIEGIKCVAEESHLGGIVIQVASDFYVHLISGIKFTGAIGTDAISFLIHHNCPKTADHCTRVAMKAGELALSFEEDAALAETAGYLHDISAVIPPQLRMAYARLWNLAILSEEERFPMIIHQKLSAEMAHKLFGITDLKVLSAIGCHTTLKARSTNFDKILFLADKIEWDQTGKPPYLDGLLKALNQSLNDGILFYINDLWQQRHNLPVIHPWLIEAYEELNK